MKLIFLGTSAGMPTRTRNVSSILLNLQNPIRTGVWLFDCGEGTQHQLLRTTFHPGKVEKIFVTHLHGDHIFGLSGLLCSRSMSGNTSPLIIYGPIGIREFLETALRLSGSLTDFSLKIIEISAGPIFEDKHYIVTAYLLNHSVECYGYRIEERDKPGTLDALSLKASGINPGPIFRSLKQGKTIILNDGRVVHGTDYVSPSLPGKKLAIFGDTAPCPAAKALALKVDLMVHEATLESSMEEKANSRGHSSSRQAAYLAKISEVGRLIVTHISSRYNEKGRSRLLQECQQIFPDSALAEDFSSFNV